MTGASSYQINTNQPGGCGHFGRKSTTRRALPTLRSIPPSPFSSTSTLLPT